LKEQELLAWASTATAGQRITYHEGFMARDCGGGREKPPTPAELSLGETRDLAYGMAELGLVFLVQKRFGPGDYAYIAVRSTKPIRSISFNKERAQ
jgi:hypothetical protein